MSGGGTSASLLGVVVRSLTYYGEGGGIHISTSPPYLARIGGDQIGKLTRRRKGWSRERYSGFKPDYAFRQAWSEPASNAAALYDHYRRLGLGGDTSMSEIVLPMHHLLALGFGSHVAVRLTEDHVRSRLQELFMAWLENNGTERRDWHKRGVKGQHVLDGGSAEDSFADASRPVEDFARLTHSYSRIGVGGGVSLSHLVLAGFDLLAMEVDRAQILEIAMASVRRHLEILALQWQEVLDMDSSMTNREKSQAILISTRFYNGQGRDEPEHAKQSPENPESTWSIGPSEVDGDGCCAPGDGPS